MLLGFDGELHCWLQSVLCIRRAQPISCKRATLRKIVPKLLSSSDLVVWLARPSHLIARVLRAGKGTV